MIYHLLGFAGRRSPQPTRWISACSEYSRPAGKGKNRVSILKERNRAHAVRAGQGDSQKHPPTLRYTRCSVLGPLWYEGGCRPNSSWPLCMIYHLLGFAGRRSPQPTRWISACSKYSRPAGKGKNRVSILKEINRDRAVRAGQGDSQKHPPTLRYTGAPYSAPFGTKGDAGQIQAGHYA